MDKVGGDSGDPLARLVAWLGEAADLGSRPVMGMGVGGDPLERVGEWIAAARDLSVDWRGEQEGVLGELLGRIAAARDLSVESPGELGLLAVDAGDPLVTIAGWIREESREVGGVRADVGGRGVSGRAGASGVSVASGESGGVEAAVGRAVLAMIGEASLGAGSRQEAVRLLATAMDSPSPEALRAVLRILISGD